MKRDREIVEERQKRAKAHVYGVDFAPVHLVRHSGRRCPQIDDRERALPVAHVCHVAAVHWPKAHRAHIRIFVHVCLVENTFFDVENAERAVEAARVELGAVAVRHGEVRNGSRPDVEHVDAVVLERMRAKRQQRQDSTSGI